MEATKVRELKLFVERCRKNPTILRDPSLSFRDYLQSIGAEPAPSPPPAAWKSPSSRDAKIHVVKESDEDVDNDESHGKEATYEEHVSDSEIIESDIELEVEIVEPDNDPPQKMGDPSLEVMEESHDASQVAKGKAMEGISEGKLEKAIEHRTEAVLLNPTSAIMYTTRATVNIRMKKPIAAICDANAALKASLSYSKINPDFTKGYKMRGMAFSMLGEWEEAATDLHLASKLDYDEEIYSVLKKIELNVHREEREERERQPRKAEAQVDYEKAKKKVHSSSRPSGGMRRGFPGVMPGGFPGSMPGAAPGNIDMREIRYDPEFVEVFGDPEVLDSLEDGWCSDEEPC